MDRLLDAAEVSRILSVRKRWVYDAMQRGDLPCVRVGPRYLRVRESDLHRWLVLNHRPSHIH